MSTLIEQRLKEAMQKVKGELERKGCTDRSTMDTLEAWNALMQAKIDAERSQKAKPVN